MIFTKSQISQKFFQPACKGGEQEKSRSLVQHGCLLLLSQQQDPKERSTEHTSHVSTFCRMRQQTRDSEHSVSSQSSYNIPIFSLLH